MLNELRLGSLHEPLGGRSWSSAEATQWVAGRAAHLHRLGVKPEDRVFLHYGNSAAFFIDVVALWSLGAGAAPVDPRCTAFEIETMGRAVAPVFSVWDREPDRSSAAALTTLGVRIIDGADVDGEHDSLAWRNGLPRLDDDALYLFTSGSTGEPKCVVHTHRSLLARWNSQRDRLGTAANERTLCLLPTHLSWGLAGNCLYAWLAGQSLFVTPALRTDVILQLGKLCDEHSITSLPTVPAMWRLALRTAAPPGKRTLRRVLCGTAPLAASLAREIGKWSGADEVVNVYGSTEAGSIAGNRNAAAMPEDGMVGEPWGSTIRILDPASNHADPLLESEMRRGEPGAIWVRTPSLMRGYFMRDDLTQQVVSRGWFSTGDVGALDDRNLLHLLGRSREMINVGGIKVYPADIDAAFARCDGVLDACAFGFDDPLRGEDVGIALVLRDRSDAALGQVFRWTVTHLAKHQVPRRWYLVDEVARTAGGKLLRSSMARACEALRPVDQRALERDARAASSDVP